MYKIRRVSFVNHPVLKNLSLDFCDVNGNAVDTVFFAGENGNGKSTILNELYKAASHSVNYDQVIEYEHENNIFTITYTNKVMSEKTVHMWANDGKGMNTLIVSLDIRNRYPFSGVFSDVDINFNSEHIRTVTSLNLDSNKVSCRSTNDLSINIKQLLVDVQSLDDAEIANEVRKNNSLAYKDIKVNERMQRFTRAFNIMFSNLTYSHVETNNNHKAIIFSKYNSKIEIDNLSSGEKQIVYRGCFLLKNVKSTNGAFIFIDEPEISLHPSWQNNIMNYYKNIFTNSKGIQTSQIFAVTHSPFIIHNDNRRNDKVIVLARDENGDIIVKDKAEYYKCNSVAVIQDAFSIGKLLTQKATVYLEGRTDEMYFNKVLKVFNYQVPFQFKWVGYFDDRGKERNSGSSGLNRVVETLISINLSTKNVCLFDCDTNKEEAVKNNIYTRIIPQYENNSNMKKGIENALVLDQIGDISRFYSKEESLNDYGGKNVISNLKKMELCNYLCSLDSVTLKKVFINLKKEVDKLIKIFR